MRVVIIYGDAPKNCDRELIEPPVMVFEVTSVYFEQESNTEEGFVHFKLAESFPSRIRNSDDFADNDLVSACPISRKDFEGIKAMLLKDGFADLTAADLFPDGFV